MAGNASGFDVQTSLDGETYVSEGIAPETDNAFVVDGLTPATLYFVRVVAFNSVANSTIALIIFPILRVASGAWAVTRSRGRGQARRGGNGL